MAQPQEILDFWFGQPGDEHYGRQRKVWFQPTPEFDEAVRRRFSQDYQAAAAGKLDAWEKTPVGALALLLLLDQVSNILHRGQAGAFETDARAREVARQAIEQGFDEQFPPVHRWFFYLPLEHSEDESDQARSVALFERLAQEHPTDDNREALDFAVRHQRVVARFGRFPNRNAALGRESTPEELEFLAGPNAPF